MEELKKWKVEILGTKLEVEAIDPNRARKAAAEAYLVLFPNSYPVEFLKASTRTRLSTKLPIKRKKLSDSALFERYAPMLERRRVDPNASLKDLGEIGGITGERARQILRRAGLLTPRAVHITRTGPNFTKAVTNLVKEYLDTKHKVILTKEHLLKPSKNRADLFYQDDYLTVIGEVKAHSVGTQLLPTQLIDYMQKSSLPTTKEIKLYGILDRTTYKAVLLEGSAVLTNLSLLRCIPKCEVGLLVVDLDPSNIIEIPL